MRLDARKGIPGPMVVWDAEACRQVRGVVWVDDVTAEYGCHYDPMVVVGDTVMIQTLQARKIVIRIDLRLVVLNPIEDSESYLAEIREEASA